MGTVANFFIKARMESTSAMTRKSLRTIPRATSSMTASGPPSMSWSKKHASDSTGSQAKMGGSIVSMILAAQA
jgi:hypothetical protein